MSTWVDVPVSQVQVGDLADRIDRDLDPRPVAEVDTTAGLIWIEIGGKPVGPLDPRLYTYRREVQQP